MLTRALFLLSLLTAATPAWADDDAQLWTGASISGTVAGPVDLSVDAITRFSDREDGLYQAVVSGQLGYHVSKNVVLWGGYVRAIGYARDASPTIEQRGRQQLTADLGHGIALRLRTE